MDINSKVKEAISYGSKKLGYPSLREVQQKVVEAYLMQIFPLEFGEISTLVKLFVGVVHSSSIVNIWKVAWTKQ